MKKNISQFFIVTKNDNEIAVYDYLRANKKMGLQEPSNQ